MADQHTYDSEMSQPSHRPGMEGAVNRATAGAGGTSVGQGPRKVAAALDDGRNVASPPTRSAFGADSRSDPAPKAQPTPAAPQAAADSSGVGGRMREQHIMDEVAKAGG